MTAATLRMDLEVTRARTRWTMTTSVVAHALLFLWIALHHAIYPDLTPITEITLIEPGDIAAGNPSPARPASGTPISGVTARTVNDQQFQRPMLRSEIEPDPQNSWVFADRLTARLTAMQQDAHATGAATSPVPTSMFGSAPAAVGGGSGFGPVSLNRGGGGGSAPLPLVRGGGGGTAPALATVSGAGVPGTGTSPAPARGGDSGARRTVAGASITGPIADRPVLSYTVPVYPEWAKHDAVEGAVTLYFVVRPDGGVKENIVVQKTAGFGDFDENARTALRVWRFKPLTPGQIGEQWGMITFHFRLRDAG